MNKHSINGNTLAETDYSKYETIGHAITDLVASVTDTRAVDVHPLFNSTNVEALDNLFQDTDSDERLEIKISVQDFLIIIHNDGEIVIKQ